jgi:hypothetical protein
MALQNAAAAASTGMVMVVVPWVGAVGLEVYAAAQLWRTLAQKGRLGRSARFGLTAFVGLLVLSQAVLLVPAVIAALPGNRLGQFGGSPIVFFVNCFAAFFLAYGPILVAQVCAPRLGWSGPGRLLANAPLALKLMWVSGVLLVVMRMLR